MTDSAAGLQAILADRFRIERELGRGGMATVYLAYDLRQERSVALKVIRPEVASVLGTDRFLREIKVTAKLRHPHILPLFESGEASGTLWYTMPYVEGGTLRHRLSRESRLSVQEACRITRDVLAGLTHAHAQGIIHRDIKPENILLDGGEAVLADFGIAHAVTAAGTERLTNIGLALGTPAYMSPEQATGGRIDGRSDVYSVGCVLHEMLTGRLPARGTTKQAPPPEAVPPKLLGALQNALAIEPELRFRSATEFAAALGDGSQPGARPVGSRKIAVVAAAVLVALGLTFYAGRRIPSEAAASGSVASGLNQKLTQLTFTEGIEEWPAWSPDGAQLAYVAEVRGVRQLFLRALSTGAERRVTNDRSDDIQPSWAPGGDRIAFVRAKSPGGKLEPNDINGWYQEGGDIWSMEIASGKVARLVEDAFSPAYSPITGRLAFEASWGGARRIWVADSTGRNPRQITADSSEAVVHTGPRWSPDGSQLVFRRIESIKSDIMTVDVASQALTRVTNDNAINMDPVWAADGQHIYFSSSRGGGLNLWRIRLGADRAATPPVQLTTGAGDDVQPAAADGGRVAFAVRGINSDLWRLPVSPTTGLPTGQPQSWVKTTRVESRGAWAPNGRSIAFNSDRLGEMNIWLRSVSDSAERQLTRGPGGDYQPSWSPDGNRIVFFSARAGNADIWSADVPDGRLTRLTDDPATDVNPFFSPDGKRIAFASDRGGRAELWVMDANGAAPRRVAPAVAGGHFLRWTDDSRGIVFRVENGTQVQIFRVSVDNGSMTRLRDVASGAHMSFSPDRSRILDVRGHKTLMVYPMDGSEPQRVFAFDDPDVRIDYPTWSPDGRWILFDRAAPRGGDLWLIEGTKQR